jgi:hypothetical protein
MRSFADASFAFPSPGPDRPAGLEPVPAHASRTDAARASVDYIVEDCFFSVGQAIGDRKALDFEAVVWWRDHFRAKFLRTLDRSGDTWRQDRNRVTAVAHLLAERAVRHAGDRPSIDLACAMKAAGDVEAYCAIRAHGRRGARSIDGASPLHAGYWCLP